MGHYFKLLFALPFLTLPLHAEAQILNKIKKAAKQGVQNAVEKRVATEIENAAQRQTEKYLEQVFGAPSQSEGGIDYGSLMKGANMNVEVADSYSFKGYTDMEITGTDEKGKVIDPMQMKSLLSEDSGLWAIEMATDEKDLEKTTMIFDTHNKASVLLMENKKGEKYHMAYGIDWEKMMEEAADKEMEKAAEESPDIVKTGNTKTINGHLCDEYKSETEEYLAHFWITRDPIDGYSSFWSKNNAMISNRMKQQGTASWSQMPQGDLMEMNHQSKTDKSSSVLKVLEINSSQEFDFQMSDYPNAMTANQ